MQDAFRSSGALAPLFSTPGVRDVGSLGRGTRRFVDDLAESGQSWWQMLPINPIDDAGSPYAGRSAFAGETLYLDLEELRDEKLLDDDDLERAWFLSEAPRAAANKNDQLNAADKFKQKSTNARFVDVPKIKQNERPDEIRDPRSERIDYAAAFRTRRPLWEKAFDRFRRGVGGDKYRAAERRFRAENAFWLDDFVLFQTAAETFGTFDWNRWSVEFRRRDAATLADFAAQNAEKLEFLRFLQLVFDVQWNELRAYCRRKSIRLFGDVPIYIGRSSADVWTFPELFEVDADGRIVREAGVPADDFNPDGQRWGSPIYRWKRHGETDFAWWRRRMAKTISRFDVVRLDHFIGFYNFYSFPGEGAPEKDESRKKTPRLEKASPTTKAANSKSASSKNKNASPSSATKKASVSQREKEYEEGWEPGPQEAFFDAIFAETSVDAFVAEDLGVMNEGVRRLRDRYDLPGMNVFQFSFDGVEVDAKTGEAPDPIERWTENYVGYAGTHDAAPILGWLSDVAKYGGGAWETLDFSGIANVLTRYRRPGDLAAATSATAATNSDDRSETEPVDERPKLGVSTRFEPLAPEIAAFRTAALRAVASSKCRLAIFPIQDVVGLSNDARINFPGIEAGNWTWRLADGALTPEIKAEWRRVTAETERLRDANATKNADCVDFP